MAKLIDNLPPENGWTEINAPELVTWKTPGDIIAGVLTQINQIVVKGKKVTQYTIANANVKYKLLATYDLLQKIGPEHIGCKLRIKYRGENSEITGGSDGTPMKVFSVQFWGSLTPASNHGPITDEDIPF